MAPMHRVGMASRSIVTELLEKDLNRLLLREQSFIPLWQRLDWAKQAITGYANHDPPQAPGVP